jgi:hypothetical protein
MYADDISLWVRKLSSIYEDYAGKYTIQFSDIKSYCIFIAPAKYNPTSFSSSPLFTREGQRMEYVSQWPHLGHTLLQNSNDREDITLWRSKIFDQNYNVLGPMLLWETSSIYAMKIAHFLLLQFLRIDTVLYVTSRISALRICVEPSWRQGLRSYDAPLTILWILLANYYLILLTICPNSMN